MTKKVTVVLVVILMMTCRSQGQELTEKLIDWNASQSCFWADLLQVNENDYVLIAGMKDYDPNNDGRTPWHGEGLLDKEVIRISRDSMGVDSIVSLGKKVPYFAWRVSPVENKVIGIGVYDTMEVDLANGNMFYNNGLHAGGIDLSNNSAFYLGFDNFLQVWMIDAVIEDGGYIYILYSTENFNSEKPEKKSTVLEKRSPDFNLIQRTDLGKRLSDLYFDKANSEYISIGNDIEKLTLSGQLTTLATDVEIEMSDPGFCTFDQKIYSASKNVGTNTYTIHKYDYSGVNLGEVVFNHPIKKIKIWEDKLLVVFEAREDTVEKPISVILLDEDLNELYNSGDIGYKTVSIDEVNIVDDELIVLGTTGTHYSWQGYSAKDQLYFLSLNLMDVLPESEKEKDSNIEVYPNPVNSEMMNIYCLDVDFYQYPDSQITFTNINGEIYRIGFEVENKHSIKADVSSLPKGVNFINLFNKEGSPYSKKFIVE